jgi:Exostosin family
MKVTAVFFTFLVSIAAVLLLQHLWSSDVGKLFFSYVQSTASTISDGRYFNLTSPSQLNSPHGKQDNTEKASNLSSIHVFDVVDSRLFGHNTTVTKVTNTNTSHKKVSLSDLVATETGLIPTKNVAKESGVALRDVNGSKEESGLSTTQVTQNDTQINRSSSQKCKYDFKVYVYEVPWSIPSVRVAAEARVNRTLHVCKKCLMEQFALEYIISDFFLQFCGRTFDPAEADFFYLPLIRDAEYRDVLLGKSNAKRDPSYTEEALLNTIEKGNSTKWKEYFNITDKFWRAHGGSDHIIVMPAPVTNLRHESGKRGFFHYMFHLHTPIFLCLEYSLSFVKEYPVCSTQKNIIVPYPTTDPDLYNGKLHDCDIQRSALMYYAGGIHGDCIVVRKAMKILVMESATLPGVLPHVKAIQAEREHGFRAATFCPVPVGDSPSSKRMYDVMNFGCIPVVLSDDLLWAFSQQSGGPLDHTSFSIQMPQAVVQFSAGKLLMKYNTTKSLLGMLPDGEHIYDLLEASHKAGGSRQGKVKVNALVQILQKVSSKNIEILRAGVKSAAPHYRYYLMNSSMNTIPTAEHRFPTGGAIDMLALQLSQIKAIGTDNIKTQCIIERGEKHKYLDHYPCDESLRR